MEKLYSLLSNIRSDIDFKNEEALIDDGLLDSVDILTIVTAISEEFKINIPITYIIPENFNSADAMFKMISLLKK